MRNKGNGKTIIAGKGKRTQLERTQPPGNPRRRVPLEYTSTPDPPTTLNQPTITNYDQIRGINRGVSPGLTLRGRQGAADGYSITPDTAGIEAQKLNMVEDAGKETKILTTAREVGST